MKIRLFNERGILFDNENSITFDHQQDCCEDNYADFLQLEPMALEVEFDENILIEEVKHQGFRFGSKDTPMFFIPCYSYQNGYYSSDVEIYYTTDTNQTKLYVECEERN